tara:strand:- start:139 stop:513 length:375 start_codon:yes stop_codon:yes gene_type:complete
MAVTSSKQNVPLTYHTTLQTDCDATVANNITGTNSTLYAVEIDNDANGSEINFIKFYDAFSATVGTDDPYLVLQVDADEKNVTYHIPQGLTFTNGICLAGVSDGGGTAGTTSPGASIVVRLIHS